MGGSLRAESELGKGSCFYYTLPLENINVDIQKETKEEIKNSFNWFDKNILVVEDENVNYLFLQKILSKTNVNIAWDENGKDGVAMVLDKSNFDIVLMDIKMPVMNGYEAAKIIKSKRPEQIIIAQIAYARSEDE